VTEGRRRLLFLVSEDWYFVSHRLHLARAAQAAGFEVAVATRVGSFESLLEAAGLKVFPLSLRRASRNPLREFAAVCEIVGIYRRFRPHVVHHVALKPSLYGSVAAMFARVPVVINALAGLGYVFTSAEAYARVLRPLVLAAFRVLFGRDNTRVILQNTDDRALLVGLGVVPEGRTSLVRGAGVDIETFHAVPVPGGVPQVVFPARMLWDKGLREFVDAARLLKGEGCEARFVLVGEPDPHNPASADEAVLRQWVADGLVEWWGRRDDMPQVFQGASVVCLPSYREGLPKVLLEAAACGRPIVATDVPGCREIVIPRQTGLLVPPRDPKALAEAIAHLLGDRDLSARLGANGRRLVEDHFSEEKVAYQTLAVYREMLAWHGF
jgi:glycosyltransferase involved in cell wall biosynthesis